MMPGAMQIASLILIQRHLLAALVKIVAHYIPDPEITSRTVSNIAILPPLNAVVVVAAPVVDSQCMHSLGIRPQRLR